MNKEMKQYIGTKIVKAMPMTMTKAQKMLGREIKPTTVEEDGYLVEYKEDIGLGLLRVCLRKPIVKQTLLTSVELLSC